MNMDRFLAPYFIPLHVSLKLLVLVRKDELVWQMVLIEVVDQVPETLLVMHIATEATQVYLKVPISVQLAANVLIEHRRALKLCLELSIPGSGLIATLVSRSTLNFRVGPVDLFADRNLKIGLRDLVSAESAYDDCLTLLILDRISNCLSELRGEKLALAIVAFLLELEPNLLTVNLIADTTVAVRCLEGTFTEV